VQWGLAVPWYVAKFGGGTGSEGGNDDEVEAQDVAVPTQGEATTDLSAGVTGGSESGNAEASGAEVATVTLPEAAAAQGSASETAGGSGSGCSGSEPAGLATEAGREEDAAGRLEEGRRKGKRRASDQKNAEVVAGVLKRGKRSSEEVLAAVADATGQEGKKSWKNEADLVSMVGAWILEAFPQGHDLMSLGDMQAYLMHRHGQQLKAIQNAGQMLTEEEDRPGLLVTRLMNEMTRMLEKLAESRREEEEKTAKEVDGSVVKELESKTREAEQAVKRLTEEEERQREASRGKAADSRAVVKELEAQEKVLGGTRAERVKAEEEKRRLEKELEKAKKGLLEVVITFTGADEQTALAALESADYDAATACAMISSAADEEQVRKKAKRRKSPPPPRRAAGGRRRRGGGAGGDAS